MKKVYTLLACISASFILHAQEFGQKAGTVLYNGNFDGLQAGDYVAQSHPVWWTTWNNKPGSSEDALITAEQAASVPNSLKIKYGTDLVFKAGNKTAGSYTIDFEMYVPNDGQAYFSLLQDFSQSTSRYAIVVVFNGIHYSLPYPNVITHNNQFTNFTFPFDEWFPVSLFMDLDNDIGRIKINNIQYLQWTWSIDYVGWSGIKQLAGVNICPNWYPPNPAAFSYYDNFVFASLTNTSVPTLSVAPTFIDEEVTPGEIVTITKPITITNSGNAAGLYQAWLDGVSNNWISLQGTTSGTIASGGDASFDAVIKTEGLPNGTYTATLKISTNDPNFPLFEIPCTLVYGTPELSVNPTSIIETITEGGVLTKQITITNTGNAAGEYEAKLEGISGDWISLSGATTGTVAGSSSKTFDAVINAEGLSDGAYTATIKITTNDPVNPLFEIPCTLIVLKEGITMVTLGDRITVYPNPTNGMINVQCLMINVQNIEIFDIMGHTVGAYPCGRPENTEITLDLLNLPSGIYFVRIQTETGVITKKIIKQ